MMKSFKFLAVASIVAATWLVGCDDEEGKPELPDTVVTCADLNCTADQYCGKDANDLFVCLDKGDKGATCSENDQCKGELKCIENVCAEDVVVPSVTCDSLNCTEEQYCGKNIDNELACLAKGELGDYCSDDVPCRDEFQCIGGACSDGLQPPDERTCDELACDPDTQYCVKDDTDAFYCESKGAEYEACSDEAPCQEGLLCKANVCSADALEEPATVRIHEVYVGGGLSDSTFKAKYAVLHNTGDTDVNVSSWTLRQASATGIIKTCELKGSIAAKGFYLVEVYASADTSRFENVAVTCTGDGKMSFTTGSGSLLLYSSNTVISGTDISSLMTEDYVDGFGYGTANFYEGTAASVASTDELKRTTAFRRKASSCGESYDTDNNSADFEIVDISGENYAPANSTTAPITCATE